VEQKFSLNPAAAVECAGAGSGRGVPGPLGRRYYGTRCGPERTAPGVTTVAAGRGEVCESARAQLGTARCCTGSRRGGVRAPPRRPGLGAGSIVRL